MRARRVPSVLVATWPGGIASVVLEVTNAKSVPWAILQEMGTPVDAALSAFAGISAQL